MIRVDLQNVSSFLSAPPAVCRAVNEATRVKIPERVRRFYRTAFAPEFHEFLSRKTGRFPTGLLPLVLDECRLWDRVRLVDQRPPITFRYAELDSLDYRPDQATALRRLAASVIGDRHWQRGIFWLPTASGKTAVIAGIAKGSDGRVLVTAHKQSVMDQTASELERLVGEEVGRCGAGAWDVKPRLIVAMMQSLHARFRQAIPEILQRTDVLCYDEVHHLAAPVNSRLIRACNATIRVGLSATPWKHRQILQQRRVMALTGPVLHRARNVELVKQRVISRVTYRIVPLSLVDGAWRWHYDFAQRQLIWRSAERNGIIARYLAREPTPQIAMVNRHEHGYRLATLLQAPFVTGDDPLALRTATLNALRAGTLPRIVACQVFEEGVDVPLVRRIALCSGGKSDIELLQRVGRSQRAKPEMAAEVLDFWDGSNRHLERHSRARVATARREGFDVVVDESWGSTMPDDGKAACGCA